MADRVEVGTVTAAAGTLVSAPATVDLSFPPGTVSEVEIVIPAGHAGLTGIALGQGGQVVIPATAGAYIIGDSDVIRWPLDGFLDNGSWFAQAYNTDVFDHQWFVRFLVTETAPVIAAPSLPLSGVTP